MAARSSIMAFKFYGHPASLCSQRPLLVLAEKGITDFKFESVNFMKGEHKTTSYRDKHPFVVIPFLEEGDFKLFESEAIARYLSTKYHSQGTQLTPAPEDIQGWALFNQWASVHQTDFWVYAQQVLTQKYWNPGMGLPTVEAILDDGLKRIEPKLDVLNKILGDQQYLGGNQFSAIDIFYMPTVNQFHFAGLGYLIDSRPNLKSWWGRVTSRPSWKKISADAMASFS